MELLFLLNSRSGCEITSKICYAIAIFTQVTLVLSIDISGSCTDCKIYFIKLIKFKDPDVSYCVK